MMNRWISAGLFFISVCLVTLPVRVFAATYAYIPNYEDDTVTRIDTESEEVSSVDLTGGPYGAAVMPDGRFVLVTATDDHVVARITNSNFSGSGTPQTLDVGETPRGVAIESSGLYAYVANYADDKVTKIDLSSFTVDGDAIEVGNGPWGIAAHYDEAETLTRVYVSNHEDDSITVISDDNLNITTETISNVGNGPIGLALTPDGRFLYVANYNNGNAGTVAIVQTSDHTIIQTIDVQRGPWGVAVGSDGAYVYVTNSESDSVTVIRTSDRTIERTYAVSNQPMGAAAPKNGDFAYIINQLSDSINRIDHIDQANTTTGTDEIHGAFALGAFIGGTPPDAPSNLEAEAVSYSRIELTWDSNGSTTDITGFKIERRQEDETEFEQIAKVDDDQTTYEDSGLADHTIYEYRVRAFNQAADSDYSNVAEATTEEGSFSWCFIGTIMH